MSAPGQRVPAPATHSHARLAAAVSAILATAEDLAGFTLVNARAGFGFGKAWRADAYVDNLTNQEAATSLSTAPGPAHDRALFVGRPRTIGIDVNYSFKDR